ncbi:MAG: hypothetical protein IIA85_02500 [Nanoarchaeota archaeon]|nr:hypothetical protein [Nanoarchaeota archaeon]
MGLFGFRRNDRVIDLSERYRKQQKQSKELANSQKVPVQTEEKSAAPLFPFFDSSPKPEEKPEVLDIESIEERKKKLAKRLMDITNKLEEISNQLYHLSQRVEVLEKKSKVTNHQS